MIPYSCQFIEEDDVQLVTQALKEPFLTQGPYVTKFEEELAKKVGAKYAIAASSATAALHITCCALGINNIDLVWTTPISFAATANCALYLGAKVDFIDIDPATGNMSIDLLEDKLVLASKNNTIPRLLIAMHYSGSAMDMQRVRELSEKFKFLVLEDAAHALGSRHTGGEAVGSCKYSDAVVFSFHALKSITTGEGGMILTDDRELADRCRLFVTHGITRDKMKLQQTEREFHYYEQIHLGFNYRLTDFQSALGLSQLNKLDRFVLRRRQIAEKYIHALKHSEIELPLSNSQSAWHLFPIKVAKEKRDKLYRYLLSKEIGSNVHYLPIYLHPYYANLGFNAGLCPNAESFYKQELSIPIHPKLTDDQQSKVVQTITDFFSKGPY